MKVKIEVSGEEAAWLRTVQNDQFQLWSDALLTRLRDALPRPIQVGDKVAWGDCTYPVLAVFNEHVWVGDDESGPWTVRAKDVRLTEGTSEQ